MNVSSASATSAAARMDIEKAAQDARTMFFITCAPLTGKTGRDFAGAPQQALRKIMRAPDERRQAPVRLSRSRRRQETASFPGNILMNFVSGVLMTTLQSRVSSW